MTPDETFASGFFTTYSCGFRGTEEEEEGFEGSKSGATSFSMKSIAGLESALRFDVGLL